MYLYMCVCKEGTAYKPYLISKMYMCVLYMCIYNMYRSCMYIYNVCVHMLIEFT